MGIENTSPFCLKKDRNQIAVQSMCVAARHDLQKGELTKVAMSVSNASNPIQNASYRVRVSREQKARVVSLAKFAVLGRSHSHKVTMCQMSENDAHGRLPFSTQADCSVMAR